MTPPVSAADARALIAAEVVKPHINPTRLEQLHKCLRVFERSEQQVRKDREIAALENQNRIAQDSLDLRKAEYRRRALNTSSGSIITFNLQRENELLKQRITELESSLGVQSATRGVNA
jgi:hypothetical protein